MGRRDVRVLVVDDDFMVARVHRGFVERTDGFAVVGTVHSGADALAAVAQLRPDLVLLDVYLPDMSGLTVLQRLRGDEQRDLDVDVLVVTAARDVDTVKQAMRGGVVNYIVKPFTYEHLRERLLDYAQRRGRLAGLKEVTQHDVDEAITPARTATRARQQLPKGLAAETADVVTAALRTAGADGLSATECAEGTGLSRVSARRYLEHLVACERAVVRLRYGATGRPERRYVWSG